MKRSRPHSTNSLIRASAPRRALSWSLGTLFVVALAGCAPSDPTGVPSGTGNSSGGGGSGTGGATGSAGAPGTGGIVGTGGTPVGGTGGTGTGGVGTGGAGTGGRGGSTAGTGGTPAGTAGAGGKAPPSTDPATFGLNGPSKCAAGNFAICEDFEATAVGAIPTGWAKEGTWVTAVSDVDKARGAHALRINVDIVNNGRGFLNKTAAQLGPLASKHYGRIFYKLQNPPNLFVHWDFFHGPGPFNGGTNDVRWGFTGTGGPAHNGTYTYLFNVQPSLVGEFGINSPAAVRLVVDTWTCVEWLLDSTVAGGGEARFWVNGTEVPNMHRTGAQAQIPVFTRYGIGWELFNTTDTPSIAYIDEVVFDSQPIGCNN